MALKAGGATMAVPVIVQNRGRPGLIAGLLGCVFGVLGIFSLGLVFVPLAALCSFVGFLRGIFGGSASGIGTSLLGAVLCVFGFATSPSLWAITVAGILASNPPARSTSTASSTVPSTLGPSREASNTAHLNALRQRLDRASVDMTAQLGKFPPVEQRYRAITGAMHTGLARQQSIYGPGQAMVARSQIAVAINQTAIQGEQLHNGIQTAQRDIRSKLEPLVRDAVNTRTYCQPILTSRKGNEQLANEDPHLACLKFMQALSEFDEIVRMLGEAFNQAEKVWVEERRKQAGIIQAADIASR
jgi:hypothetical protein